MYKYSDLYKQQQKQQQEQEQQEQQQKQLKQEPNAQASRENNHSEPLHLNRQRATTQKCNIRKCRIPLRTALS